MHKRDPTFHDDQATNKNMASHNKVKHCSIKCTHSRKIDATYMQPKKIAPEEALTAKSTILLEKTYCSWKIFIDSMDWPKEPSC